MYYDEIHYRKNKFLKYNFVCIVIFYSTRMPNIISNVILIISNVLN